MKLQLGKVSPMILCMLMYNLISLIHTDSLPFLRKAEDEVLLIVANFSKDKKYIGVTIPSHAFEFLGLSTGNVVMTDLLSGDSLSATLEPNKQVEMEVDGYYGRVYKFMIKK